MMKNTFGNSIAVTLFGESHGEYIGAVIDGLAPGIEIDEKYIEHMLYLRRPSGKISTARREKDCFRIVSGAYKGRTTGTPLTVLIPNEDTDSRSYEEIGSVARPSHADYTAECKYHGFQDVRGAGHFSGRITAALVAAGAICMSALEKKGITVATHIKSCAGVRDRDFCDYKSDALALRSKELAVLDVEAEKAIREKISLAAADGDSVGGILETVITGIPAGVGEPWFDSVESLISHMMFSIPAVKGIEFGAGFSLADMRGSQANDPFRAENGRIYTETNNNGGINGGITNGMPVIFRTAIKPTPTVFMPQRTVNLRTKEEITFTPSGRHDPAVIHRARAVQDAATAIVICDLIAMRYGTDIFTQEAEIL